MTAGLLLIRHGQTSWNEDGRYQGRSDPPLSATGAAQAVALARTLAGSGLARVITSPLERAAATARLIAAGHGLGVETDGRLAELAFGAWEGMTQAEVKARWPDLLRLYKRSPERVRFPQGETLEDAAARLESLLTTLADEAPAAAGPIALVTHAAMIRIALLRATGRPLAGLRERAVTHCGCYRLVRVAGAWRYAEDGPELGTPRVGLPAVDARLR